MFSRRLAWDTAPNAYSSAVATHRKAGRPLIDLTESNPTRAGLADATLAPLADPRALQYDPEAWGLLAAREAVSAYYNCAVSPERILLTASTSEAYSYLLQLLCDPGDEVLAPRPSYPLFEFLAGLQNVAVRQYPLHYHEGWWLDLASLEEHLTPRTRAVIVVSPNNPTGHYLHDAAALAEFCARHSLALICDEVFRDFALDASAGPTTAHPDGPCLTFTLSGLSKVCGLPQMKLGWTVISGPADLTAAAARRLELIADTYLSVSAPVQYSAPQWLNRRHTYIEATRARTLANLTSLRRRGLQPLRVEAGWYACLRLPATQSEEQWMTALLEHNVLVQPGYFYDFESEPWAIVSLITPPAQFEQGLESLLACISRTA
ncbi:MAG: pyridoxal phosphate-dependent aminotransferase [Acidobacteriota bacterium]